MIEFFKKFFTKESSAKIAKNRLTLMLAHERSANLPYMSAMRDEILAVIQKYTGAQNNKINFKTDANQNMNLLEIEIILN